MKESHVSQEMLWHDLQSFILEEFFDILNTVWGRLRINI